MSVLFMLFAFSYQKRKAIYWIIGGILMLVASFADTKLGTEGANEYKKLAKVGLVVLVLMFFAFLIWLRASLQ